MFSYVFDFPFAAQTTAKNAPLEAVYIYFGTETYDEYERDVKVSNWKLQFSMFNLFTLQVTTEAALGLVGGTMGLLTGFSILSGVEIIYYLIRFDLFCNW